MCIMCNFFRDTNRSTNAGSHKYYEEKKVQQEKKYKLLNISFRKPVTKGILCLSNCQQSNENIQVLSYSF